MQADHWDSLAPVFDREVFSPLANNLDGVLAARLEELAEGRAWAIDLGCGTGRSVPILATHVESVLAVDHSDACLELARSRFADYDHVTFRLHDLTEPLPDPPAELGVCVNVAIMPAYAVRERVFANVTAAVAAGGRLLLVVPSVESALLSAHRLTQWQLRDGSSYREAVAVTTDQMGFTRRSIRDGVIEIGGVRTKHYLREELELTLRRHGHRTLVIDKVRYPWTTEFEDAPDSMREPYPWDWLAISTPA